jgi:predicted metal-dependent enzyme (double-stranded beta helix superfamily)
MAEHVLTDFIAACGARAAGRAPADCVEAIAPLMRDLLGEAESFLKPEHFREDETGYARNLVHEAEDGRLSLFALVWRPGQWTPVHDHGTWGVVGVLEGALEERNYIRCDKDQDREQGCDQGIDLQRGGVILMTPGTVTSFVPNPDHIHMTGVSEDRPRAVSLHLYGRALHDFHVYDAAAGTRKLIQVAHNES